MTNTCEKYGRTFEHHPDGGWVERGAVFPPESEARIFGGYVFSEAAAKMHGGDFWGGVFRGGVFRDGKFWGGDFRDGVFHGGEFRGGDFWDGEFWDGEFWGGVFLGGVFLDGVFWGGEFHRSPSMAQRSDGYCFIAKYVNDDLRIWAGCRNFSWDIAVEHWDDNHEHGAETQRILHFLKAQEDAQRIKKHEEEQKVQAQ